MGHERILNEPPSLSLLLRLKFSTELRCSEPLDPCKTMFLDAFFNLSRVFCMNATQAAVKSTPHASISQLPRFRAELTR
jgi:hypothetical protein